MVTNRTLHFHLWRKHLELSEACLFFYSWKTCTSEYSSELCMWRSVLLFTLKLLAVVRNGETIKSTFSIIHCKNMKYAGAVERLWHNQKRVSQFISCYNMTPVYCGAVAQIRDGLNALANCGINSIVFSDYQGLCTIISSLTYWSR